MIRSIALKIFTSWVKATTLDVPKNIFLSWASATGDLATEGDFVKFWRYKIALDFMEKDIHTVASEVLVDCRGGKNYIGLDPKKGLCKGGVWEWRQDGHLGPSNVNIENKKALIKSCINFAKKASARSAGNSNISLHSSNQIWCLYWGEFEDETK